MSIVYRIELAFKLQEPFTVSRQSQANLQSMHLQFNWLGIVSEADHTNLTILEFYRKQLLREARDPAQEPQAAMKNEFILAMKCVSIHTLTQALQTPTQPQPICILRETCISANLFWSSMI
jgi:hypothetical protein